MRKTASFVLGLALCAAAGLSPASAQNGDKPPDQPFQAVHLINLPSADAEKSMLSALTEINAAIAKAGCAKCKYHLWKVAGTQDGQYNHIWISSWPGRAVYEKVHSSAGYQAAIAKHQELNGMAGQVYNRYVEATPGK